MLQNMLKNQYWLRMPQDCKWYAANCLVCRRTKTYNIKRPGSLNPLPILNQKQTDISLDFVVELPKCHQQNCVFCYILVIVDRLTKQKLYKPLKSLSTNKFIEAMHWRVFLTHGYSLSIVNNCDGQITSKLWRRLCKRRGIKIKFSLTQHPKTNVQTKNVLRM